MSKGNMMLGYARGKVGSLVFARRKGEQITRAYNSNPSNPKSTAQMQQRMKWANLVNTYKALQPELQKSFENLAVGQTSYNAFMSANLGADAVYLTKAQASQGGAKIAPYIISRGSLGVVEMTGAVSSLRSSLDIDSATTVGQFSADLLAANPTLMAGDQLTAIVLQNVVVDGTPRITPLFAKIVLDIAEVATIAETFANSPVKFDVEDGFLAVKQNSDVLGLNVAFYYAAGLIVSRSDVNGLHVSDSRLAVVGSEPVSMQLGFAVAAESYGYTGDVYLNPEGYEAYVAVPVPMVSDVKVGGVALGSSIGSLGSKSITIQGQLFDEETPVLTVNGASVAVTVTSAETAAATYNFSANGTYAIKATAGTSVVEGNIIINYNGEDSSPV